MPITVDVPELGAEVEFPDGMSHDDIASAITKHITGFKDLSKDQPLTLRPPRLQGPSTTAGGPPLATPDIGQVMAQTGELAEQGYEIASKPTLPDLPIGPSESFLGGLAKGGVKAAYGIPQFLSSPIGATAAAVGAAAPLASTIGFSGVGLEGVRESLKNISENWDKMTSGEQGESISGLLASMAMFGLPAKAAVNMIRGKVPGVAASRILDEAIKDYKPRETPAVPPAPIREQSAPTVPPQGMVGLKDLTPQSEAAAVAAPPGMVGEPTTKLSPQAEAAIQEIVPAIKTMSGEVVAGEKGQSHNDIIEQNKIPAKEVDRREFVDTATGQEVSREKLATAIPTKKEGEAHSSDLAKAQEPPPEPAVAPKMQAVKDRIAALKSEMQPLADKGGLTKAEAERFRALNQELNSLRYDAAKPLTLERIPSESERQSTLPKDVVLVARNDLMRNKDVYTPIVDSATGVFFNADTPIDDIVNGKNPTVSYQQLYDAFNATREALRKKFGDAITLYRSVGQQKSKSTTNWATTKEYAEQFGGNVKSKQVPIDDIVAVNVGIGGKYHEVIVRERPPTPAPVKAEPSAPPPPAQPKGETPPTPPPVEQKGVEPEKGPGMVGMGGATPQEFEQPGTYVSNMFAAIDRDRAELGKPPMDPTVRRSWGEDNQRALAQMNRDPNWIPNLISEVLKRPRPLLSWENAGLVWQRAFWKTEYNNALKRIAQAFDDNRTEDLTAAKTDAAVFEDKLEELDRAVGRNGTGSEAGRTLQAQKMGAGDDFTLIEMTLQKRAAVGGRRLTAEESANLEKEHARLEALNTELQKELATRDERLAKSEADRAMAELKAKGVPTFDKRILAAAENIVSKMETAADAARERIKARFAQPGAMSGPIDPTLIDDFAVVASAKIARAGLDLAKLTDDMAREFGDMVKEHMPAIWTRANEMLDNITAKVPDPVKRIVRKQGLDEQKQVFIENIKEKAAKGEKKSFNWYVQKMARELYKSGITERDDLINALHGLLKQAAPDITLRQTQDAFSGYGDYKPLSKNEITVALRGMKGELQQIAKLEDMEKGKPPLKSGMARRTPTEVERKLIKLVNDAKNKFQVPVSDPETQLKSALDTLKTTLENRIKDYADRLARKDFSPRPRREIVLDSRANQLKVEAERIKKRFREELIADRLKNRNPWEKVMDWGTKLRRFDILSSPVVIPKLISAGIQRLTSLPLEEEVGGVFKRIPGYKQVFEKAPLEGGGRNLSAEMVGFKSAFMKGLKDAYDVLKTGHSELDVLYGKAGESYTGEFELMSKLLAMPGRIHGMIKAPVKRATFERAVERYAKHYLSQGIPVDDVLKTRIALDAYKAANRSIFLNDNRIALAFNAALRTAEQPLKETGHPTAGGKALATLGRITIPIVKVPLNIVAETMQYATGLVSGNVRLANAFRRGIETLTPEQADLIARELKKGSIGAAILMLGYANADAIGGYYQPGTKKKLGQPKWGSINVFGVNVPSFLLHNPLLETLQIGATIRQVADSKLKKRDKTTQGLSEGVLAAAFGVVEQTPFMREMAEIEKLRNPYTRDRFFGEQAKSLVVPAVVSKAAEWMDPLNPNLQRKPRTTTEYIKSGIPGLRQQLPAERKK